MAILVPAALVLVSLTATAILLSKDWRLSVGALALQYIGVFVLVSISWSMEMAVVKLVSGWMAGAVLGMAMIGAPGEGSASESGASESGAQSNGASESGASESGASESGASESGASESGASESGAPRNGGTEMEEERSFLPFRFLTVGLVGLVVYSLAPQIGLWVPGMGYGQVLGGLTLIGLGVLHLGFTARPFRVAIGLLTVLSGFEIFYAVMETSTLVTGLLASVNLGIALLGAYLLTQAEAEVAQ